MDQSPPGPSYKDVEGVLWGWQQGSPRNLTRTHFKRKVKYLYAGMIREQRAFLVIGINYKVVR